jgi:hypothetical protein
MEKERPDD